MGSAMATIGWSQSGICPHLASHAVAPVDNASGLARGPSRAMTAAAPERRSIFIRGVKMRVTKPLALLFIGSSVLSGCASAPVVATLAQGQVGALRLESRDIAEGDFLAKRPSGTSAIVSGDLRLPEAGDGRRVPAVILVHGCSGVTAATENWARELPWIGIATFHLDSFSGRNIREICTGRERLSTGSRVIDVYRALALLATHPRIDPARITLMGFSHGGRVALWAAFTRFQQAWAPAGARFAAHLAFYPASCWFTLREDERLAAVPVRIFHGEADDWTTIGPCRAYVERVRRSGADIAMIEYAAAHHGFDNPRLPAYLRRPDVLNPSACHFVEQEPGQVIDAATGQPAGVDAPCFTRGATVGYNAEATRQAIRDVQTFLTEVLRP